MRVAKTKQHISQALFDLKASSVNSWPSNVNNPFCAQSQYRESRAPTERFFFAGQKTEPKNYVGFCFRAKEEKRIVKIQFFREITQNKSQTRFFVLSCVHFLVRKIQQHHLQASNKTRVWGSKETRRETIKTGSSKKSRFKIHLDGLKLKQLEVLRAAATNARGKAPRKASRDETLGFVYGPNEVRNKRDKKRAGHKFKRWRF